MDNIKIIIVWLIVCGVLLFGVQHYKIKSEKLQTKLTTLQAQSKQLATDKQNEVDNTHSRANAFLLKARKEYEEKLSLLRTSAKSGSLPKSSNTKPASSNRVYSIQEPARIFESRIEYKEKAVIDTACELRYKELWNTWEGLCLIYGCSDGT